MTDRDTFAAAALTGLLAASDPNSWADDLWAADICRSAYGWADEMLRQRGTAVSNNCVTGNQPEIPCPVTEPMPKEKRAEVSDTNHDAAPATKARTDADSDRTDKAVLRPGEGTGNTPEPVAWAVVYPNDAVAVIAFKRQDAEERAAASDRIVPLYRHPQPTLTDAEREAVEAAARIIDAYEDEMDGFPSGAAATLRGLLDRTK